MFPNEPVWFSWALRELGIREVPGRGSNERILAYRKLAKIPLAGDDSDVPWCAIFLNAALEQTGILGTRSGMARSFMTWGQPLKRPAPGCIVVLSRPPSKTLGHVGLYRGETADQVYLLGGNQGDAVTIAAFNKVTPKGEPRILGYRWPLGRPLPVDGPVKIAAGRRMAEVSDR